MRKRKMTKCMACKEVEKKKKRGEDTPDVFGKSRERKLRKALRAIQEGSPLPSCVEFLGNARAC